MKLPLITGMHAACVFCFFFFEIAFQHHKHTPNINHALLFIQTQPTKKNKTKDGKTKHTNEKHKTKTKTKKRQ